MESQQTNISATVVVPEHRDNDQITVPHPPLSALTANISNLSLGTISNPSLISPDTSHNLTVPFDFPIECFRPYHTALKTASVEDCRFIIDNIIVAYPDPMLPKTFGYTDDVDIDLRDLDNSVWVHGKCSMFVRNRAENIIDVFSMADVGASAEKILRECVIGMKYGVGGIRGIGHLGKNYYVGVGGNPHYRPGNQQ